MNKLLPPFLQHPLAREIALAIVIKLAVIVVIFFAFFDGQSVSTDAKAVAERLANSPQHPIH
jgi:hypothetical protein